MLVIVMIMTLFINSASCILGLYKEELQFISLPYMYYNCFIKLLLFHFQFSTHHACHVEIMIHAMPVTRYILCSLILQSLLWIVGTQAVDLSPIGR
jgi:hypothetical protein